MSEMVERVAEATAKSDGFKSLVSVPREKREGYERRARAAIEAMREPTDGIESAITRVNSLTRSEVVGYYEAGAMWKAAIDAALTEGGE